MAASIIPILFSQSDLRGQDYRSSITATDFDFIIESDPSAFSAIEFKSKGQYELPDKRPGDQELFQTAFTFVASFSDNTKVDLVIDADFTTRDAALTEAKRYVHPLGKLPTALRLGVDRLVVHQGGEDTTAFSDIGLIVLYSENATKRISTHDLEETVFHESVHAAWDKTHANSRRWIQAQAADNTFVTMYAKSKPGREDLAESALFAYTLLHHPDRIPAVDAKKIKQAIPNRIKYIAELLPPDKPILYDVDGSERMIWDVRSEDVHCNIRLPGTFADILSHTLMVHFKFDEQRVSKFFSSAQDRYDLSEKLFQQAILEFEVDEQDLKEALLKLLHCNCRHSKANDRAARQLIESWQPKH